MKPKSIEQAIRYLRQQAGYEPVASNEARPMLIDLVDCNGNNFEEQLLKIKNEFNDCMEFINNFQSSNEDSTWINRNLVSATSTISCDLAEVILLCKNPFEKLSNDFIVLQSRSG